jgi:hypothetical protein
MALTRVDGAAAISAEASSMPVESVAVIAPCSVSIAERESLRHQPSQKLRREIARQVFTESPLRRLQILSGWALGLVAWSNWRRRNHRSEEESV